MAEDRALRWAVGSDHAGVALKRALIARLQEKGFEVEDLGTDGPASVDYPDFARAVSDRLGSGADRGLLICGTGQGMAMVANRTPGIRAAVVSDVFSARMSRAHNDANVLCLGARVVGEGLALEILDVWADAPFEGGRHQRRIDKIEAEPE